MKNFILSFLTATIIGLIISPIIESDMELFIEQIELENNSIYSSEEIVDYEKLIDGKLEPVEDNVLGVAISLN